MTLTFENVSQHWKKHGLIHPAVAHSKWCLLESWDVTILFLWNNGQLQLFEFSTGFFDWFWKRHWMGQSFWKFWVFSLQLWWIPMCELCILLLKMTVHLCIHCCDNTRLTKCCTKLFLGLGIGKICEFTHTDSWTTPFVSMAVHQSNWNHCFLQFLRCQKLSSCICLKNVRQQIINCPKLAVTSFHCTNSSWKIVCVCFALSKWFGAFHIQKLQRKRDKCTSQCFSSSTEFLQTEWARCQNSQVWMVDGGLCLQTTVILLPMTHFVCAFFLPMNCHWHPLSTFSVCNVNVFIGFFNDHWQKCDVTAWITLFVDGVFSPVHDDEAWSLCRRLQGKNDERPSFPPSFVMVVIYDSLLYYQYLATPSRDKLTILD